MCFWATFCVGADHFGKVGKACTHNNHYFQSYYLISINGEEELYSYIFKGYLRVSICKELDRLFVIITHPHLITFLSFLFQWCRWWSSSLSFSDIASPRLYKSVPFPIKRAPIVQPFALCHIFSPRFVCSLIHADLFLCVFHIIYLIIDLSVLIFVSTRFSYFPCFALRRYFIKHFPSNR